jgi:hypothetical protein
VQELSLGVLVYNRFELQVLLSNTRTDDPSLSLAANLIAARFNTGIGVDASNVYVDLVLADRAIGGFGARVPLGIDPGSPVGKDMMARSRRLEGFNRTCEGLTSDVLGGQAATPGITPGDLPSSGSGNGPADYVSWILGSMGLLVVALLLLVARQLLDSRRSED